MSRVERWPAHRRLDAFGTLFTKFSSSPEMARFGDVDACQHIPESGHSAPPQTRDGCQECLKTGSSWVHLRSCVECGKVGCCDDSPNKHAHAHYREHNDHRLIRSFEPGEAWWYCLEDEFGFEIEGTGPLR